MNGQFILDEKGEKPIPCASLIVWGKWLQKAGPKRVVKRETIGDSDVSTVFLGLDHNHFDEGPPIIWETMVFGGKLDQEQDRCSGNREQAEAMHAKMVARVRKHLPSESRPD